MVKSLTLSAVIQIILIVCLMKYYVGTFNKAYSLICDLQGNLFLRLISLLVRI